MTVKLSYTTLYMRIVFRKIFNLMRNVTVNKFTEFILK